MKRQIWTTLFNQSGIDSCSFRVKQTESRSIPDLIGKVAVRLDLFLIPTGISTPNLRQRQTCGINTVFVENIYRINSVHFCFRHALPLAVKNGACYVHIGEWLTSHELHSHHHHARHPKENYVTRGYKNRRGIELFEVLRLLWPTQCREWPKG